MRRATGNHARLTPARLAASFFRTIIDLLLLGYVIYQVSIAQGTALEHQLTETAPPTTVLRFVPRRGSRRWMAFRSRWHPQRHLPPRLGHPALHCRLYLLHPRRLDRLHRLLLVGGPLPGQGCPRCHLCAPPLQPLARLVTCDLLHLGIRRLHAVRLAPPPPANAEPKKLTRVEPHTAEDTTPTPRSSSRCSWSSRALSSPPPRGDTLSAPAGVMSLVPSSVSLGWAQDVNEKLTPLSHPRSRLDLVRHLRRAAQPPHQVFCSRLVHHLALCRGQGQLSLLPHPTSRALLDNTETRLTIAQSLYFTFVKNDGAIALGDDERAPLVA